MNVLKKCLLLVALASLASCSSLDNKNGLFNWKPRMETNAGIKPDVAPNEINGNGSAGVGGNIVGEMDQIDRTKMFKALDSGVGKSTQWKNAISDITYTVTPVAKVEIAGKSFCRKYTVKAEKRGQAQQVNGVACVGDDGNWQSA